MAMRLRFGIFIILAAGIFLIVSYTKGFRTGSSIIGSAVNPAIEHTSNFGAKIVRLITLPWRAADLEAEAEVLRQKVQVLIGNHIEVAQLRKENEELKNELAFSEKEKYPITIARVIARIKENGSTFLVVNQGSEEGIEVGMPVTVEGILVGKIIKVTQSTSVVAPLIASGIKSAATFPGNSATAGIVEGELNVNLIMRFIPKDVTVTMDSIVITSGLEERIPRGLSIGLIAKVQSSPQDLFQTAYVRPIIKSEEIAIVSIISDTEKDDAPPLTPPR
ncbi:MAG: rod shape-determining protein MreC [bacterium]|nr:rod shape-determining protein MreC [bacterium]